MPDTCLPTETRLTNEIIDGENHLPQYCLSRAERESKSNTTAHSGVLIAIHKDLKYSTVTLLIELQVQCAAAALIKLHNKTICTACIYNPPDENTYRLPINELILLFQIINNQAADCIMVMGDFNLKKGFFVLKCSV